MPLKSSGKEITKIKFNKKNIVLLFDKERCEITKDAYASMYLYVGKKLTNKEIKELKDFSSIAKLYNYALGLLKKKRYSEWKIREKLYAKEANKSEVDKVINKLKSIGLVDDKGLIEDYISYSNDKNIGKNKILKELNEKGVFVEQHDEIKFSLSKEHQKALKQLPKLEKKYSSYSFEKKKQRIYGALISLGFDNDVALDTINKVSPKDNKDEANKIKADYKKVYSRLCKKYEGRELYMKVVAALRNKGYSYKDVNKVMEEKHYDDWGI